MALHKPLFSLMSASAAAALAWPAATQAAPIELYEQPQFQGVALGLDRANPNLADYGFDNKALSIVVRSGSWELCTDAQFRGSCLVLGPGQHATLPPGLQRSLSSVRPKEGSTTPNGGGTDPNAAVVLYDDGDYSGKSLAVNGPIASLGKHGMGDRISSVEVRRGVWQLCEDSNYEGTCTTLEPGRHHLSGGMHDEASSIRPLYGPSRQPLPEIGGLTLYENSDFSGRNLLITAPTEYLGRLDFGDKTSAVDVHSGLWDICTDSVYKGRCITLGPGRHVLTGGAHDRASSVRPRLPDNSPAWRGADPERRRIY
jgi:hypothetical protein